MTRRTPCTEFRTVNTVSGASGSETGYGTWLRSARVRSKTLSLTVKSLRTRPSIGSSGSTRGTNTRDPATRLTGTSNCQPTHRSVKPCSIKKPSPKFWAVVGLSASHSPSSECAWLKNVSIRRVPRLATPNNIVPLPRVTSLGWISVNVAENSTSPSEFVGACSISTMISFAEFVGSTAKCIVPINFSYGPASP